MENHFEAVIFDMDGLIFDSEAFGRRAWEKAAKEFGFEIPDHIFAQVFGRAKEGRRLVFMNYFGNSFPFDAVYGRRIEIGDDDEIRTGLPVKEGAQELLSVLRGKKFRLALATGTDQRRTKRRLKTASLDGYFDIILTSERVPKHKPEPDIFLAAAAAVRAAPKKCLVLEDSNVGVEAGWRAGMAVIMVPDLAPPSELSLRRAWKVVGSLSDVEEMVRGGLINPLPEGQPGA